MPLDRANMTRASRITLPTYVLFFGWVGLNYLITDLDRLDKSPTLRFVDDVLDLRTLGMVLTLASLLMLGALLTKRRDTARYALVLAGICFAILFAAFLAASLRAEASPSAAAWPMLGFVGCVASYRSITSHEVQ